ncbi:hybrid sensor histidine kinase/response regulator [Tumidithrix elongata RA019]|uniref:Circadian input-output histidine kinase CikA n=1 Tax=Tumidithrix elongata BACA0141 TaxID=2716417 RepID=A0AAW9Q596_9CYAN|nr:hybrid sensor histidine kinase/response regulator [Tumidithrix elongata RA019]
MVDDPLIADVLEFADEVDETSPQSLEFWKVLIVDDEAEVHNITQLALEDFTFENKKLKFLNAYSGAEACQAVLEHPDIALVLLDVIMESDDAGLTVAKYIRETLKNRAIRIVLRTGQPGHVPERQAIVDYDIDDYKTKTELTSQKLFTTIITALRSFKAYTELESLNADLERTNTELLQATKLKDEFLSTMSHELRTPLNAILGMAECLHEELFGAISPSQKTAIATIKSSGEHLLSLIIDMLDASRIMAGMLKLDITSVAIADLYNPSLEFVKQLVLKKNIQLTTILSPNMEAIEVEVDRRRMRQVLINLLNNAVKFTPPGGKICLEVRIGNELPSELAFIRSTRINSVGKIDSTQGMPDFSSWLQFSVTDTGIGIAPTNRDRIFQPFIQLESGLNRKYEGSGLGLAMVKQIVELHGGYVDLSSQLGQGSCFTVYLPCRSTRTINNNILGN